MKKITMTLLAAALALLTMASTSSQGKANQSFGFNAASIKGFPNNVEAFLTGGGAYDPQTGFLKTGGAFRCLKDINQGPLAGCKEGEGIRWDVADEEDIGIPPLLDSFQFKCTGDKDEAFKTAVTDDNTVVMIADFYQQGDGNNESFTARMFVSADDEDLIRPGNQNVWIQGVGCGEAVVNFN